MINDDDNNIVMFPGRSTGHENSQQKIEVLDDVLEDFSKYEFASAKQSKNGPFKFNFTLGLAIMILIAGLTSMFVTAFLVL